MLMGDIRRECQPRERRARALDTAADPEIVPFVDVVRDVDFALQPPGALDAHAAVAAILNDLGVGIEPGGIDSVDGAEIGALEIAVIEDIPVFRMTLGRDFNVFYAAVAANDSNCRPAVLQTERGPVDVQVVDDRTNVPDDAGDRSRAPGLSDGEPVSAFRYGRRVHKISGDEIGDGHLDGVCLSGVNNAAAGHFQLPAAGIQGNRLAGNVVYEHAFAGPAEEAQSRISAVVSA